MKKRKDDSLYRFFKILEEEKENDKKMIEKKLKESLKNRKIKIVDISESNLVYK